MASEGNFGHFPPKPSNMSKNFYDDAIKGTAGIMTSELFYRTSGNISYNSQMAYSIKGYIDDTNNIEPNVGHRLSLLDPKAKNTVFGFANSYGTVDILCTRDTKVADSFYSWPAPGYFPVESMDANAKWSVQLVNENYYVDGTIEIKLKANGKIYSSKNGDFELYYDDSYEAYYFDLPSEIKQYLTDGGNDLLAGKKVEVEVNNIADTEGNGYEISYPVNFFTISDYLLGDVDGNGKIDAQDAVMILKYVAHNITLTNKQLLAANTTKDKEETVDAQDAVQILKLVAHNITEF